VHAHLPVSDVRLPQHLPERGVGSRAR
jgi:hypothetical protein